MHCALPPCPAPNHEAAGMPIHHAVIAFWVGTVGFSRRYAVWLLLATAILCAGLAAVTASRLGIDTDLSKLISEKEPWRQHEIAFERAFPQFDGLLVVVVDGETPDLAADAAEALTARLAARDDLFTRVELAGGGPFFEQNGLLFLPLDDLRATIDQIIAAQPFLGSLAADPSLRGLFDTLSLTLEGVERGAAKLDDLAPAFARIADSLAATLDGRFEPLSWQALLRPGEPLPEELRRMILTKPKLDFGRLEAGAAAMQAIRDTAQALRLTPEHGVQVRLTGQVAIAAEELRTIADGALVSFGASFVLVTMLLFVALRSFRLILPILVTLVTGLIITTGFAALTVGSLNPISVAFGVLYVGLAVDFGIQFSTRYRQERFKESEPAQALRRTARKVGGALTLAGACTALGFFAFLPTAYTGVSELGLIAGFGMIVAALLNMTVLPALFTFFRPPEERAQVRTPWMGPLDRLLRRKRRTVLVLGSGLALLSAFVLPSLQFDFNPMNLRNPDTESIATALDLMQDPATTPYRIEILAESLDAAAAMVPALKALPETDRVLTLRSFVPADQDEKLPLVEDARFILEPTLDPYVLEPPPDLAAERQAAASLAQRLTPFTPDSAAAARLAIALNDLATAADEIVAAATTALIGPFPGRLAALRTALTAEPVTLETLPESLRRDWLTPDGRARILVTPSGDATDNQVLRRFVEAVLHIAPDATGAAVTTQESADTIVEAFAQAGLSAVAVITLLLILTLKRLDDVLLVLAPLVLAALLTGATCATLGPMLNFANIIALPLLFGIGVAFNIYFVVQRRSGETEPLQSSTARAVLFSALTTLVAFGSLALSSHPGTASMGVLLVLSLLYTLSSTCLFLPALLAMRRDGQAGGTVA